jgi:hypothetical protein
MKFIHKNNETHENTDIFYLNREIPNGYYYFIFSENILMQHINSEDQRFAVRLRFPSFLLLLLLLLLLCHL